jgi:hypothetical protein
MVSIRTDRIPDFWEIVSGEQSEQIQVFIIIFSGTWTHVDESVTANRDTRGLLAASDALITVLGVNATSTCVKVDAQGELNLGYCGAGTTRKPDYWHFSGVCSHNSSADQPDLLCCLDDQRMTRVVKIGTSWCHFMSDTLNG